MITKWRLFNFKSVRNETELEFGPLTILAGPNSSGKSTLIQSMLLISQTLQHNISSRSVILNGALTRLGQFDDLRSVNSDANQIVIGWECAPQADDESPIVEGISSVRRAMYYGHEGGNIRQVKCEVAIDALGSGSQKDLLQLQPRMFGFEMNCVARDREGVDTTSRVTVKRNAIGPTEKAHTLGIADPDNELSRASLEFDVALDDKSLEDIHEEFVSGDAVGCLLQHFLPRRLSLRVNTATEEAHLIAAFICEGARGRAQRW